MIKIKVTQKLPNFIGDTFDGKKADLSKITTDKNLVLYFYPKDDTPGCTIEGVDFSELQDNFQKINTLVVGMSRDGLTSHERFCRRHNLKIPLLSDEDGTYGRKIGILKDTGTFKRTTILAGKDGKIKHIWEDVTAAGHAREVLGRAAELENSAKKKVLKKRDIGRERRK